MFDITGKKHSVVVQCNERQIRLCILCVIVVELSYYIDHRRAISCVAMNAYRYDLILVKIGEYQLKSVATDLPVLEKILCLHLGRFSPSLC